MVVLGDACLRSAWTRYSGTLSWIAVRATVRRRVWGLTWLGSISAAMARRFVSRQSELGFHGLPSLLRTMWPSVRVPTCCISVSQPAIISEVAPVLSHRATSNPPLAVTREGLAVEATDRKKWKRGGPAR